MLLLLLAEAVNFENLQPYDVADLIKQYFRELPECLLTNKLSETFISIFTCKSSSDDVMREHCLLANKVQKCASVEC